MNDKTLWQKIDEGLPRLWKTWLLTAVLLVGLLMLVSDPVGRFLVYVSKVPLATVGVVLAYYADRALFRRQRIDALQDAYDNACIVKDEAAMWRALALLCVAQLRRALIVVAVVVAVANGA